MSSKSLKIFGITFLVVILLYKLRIEGHEAYTEEKHADKPTQPMKIRQNEETYGKSRKNNDEHHEKHNAIERDPERIKVVQDKEKNFTYPTDFRKKTRTKFSLDSSKHIQKRRNQNQTVQKNVTKDFFASKEEKTDFKNILNANIQPENDKNIFFIETGISKSNVKLSARQCCSIESAALRNPEKRIFVVFVSRDRLNNLEITSQIKAILSYRNVQINYLNIEELSKASPIEHFIKSNKLTKSKFRLPHTSDVLRLLILYKYGGTYLDMDMMVMKTLNSTLQNFACPESEEFMNGAILNLNSHVRSNLSEIFLEDLVKNFNGALYSFNGPLLVTRVVKTLCNVKSITEITPMQDCHGFHVLKQNLCYPIEYEKWEDLLTTKNVHSVMKKVEKSLVVHFWNKFSKNKRVDVKSEVPYAQLARKSCPKLIKTCDKNF